MSHKGWQWLFMLEGMPCVVLGFIVYYYLDDTPQKTKWLTGEEKECLSKTLQAEHKQTDNPAVATGEKKTIMQELLSPTVIKFGVAYFCMVNTLAMVATWAPLIVKSFSAGASNITIGLLAAIPQVCTIIGMILWGRHSDYRQERKWHVTLPMLFAAAGWLFTAYSVNPIVQLIGICIASTGGFMAMSIFWTTPDHALSLGARAIGIAVINATGNIGSALSSVVVGWLKDLTGSFTWGLLYATVLMVIGSIIFLTIPIRPHAKPLA